MRMVVTKETPSRGQPLAYPCDLCRGSSFLWDRRDGLESELWVGTGGRASAESGAGGRISPPSCGFPLGQGLGKA